MSPSVSKKQQHLMAAAAHGATFAKAKELRASMTEKQLLDFAATSTKHLPTRVHKGTGNRFNR